MAEVLSTSALKQKVQAAFTAARIYKLPHKALMDMLKSVKTEIKRTQGTVKPRAVYSVHQQGFVLGVIQAEMDLFYARTLTLRKVGDKSRLIYVNTGAVRNPAIFY